MNFRSDEVRDFLFSSYNLPKEATVEQFEEVYIPAKSDYLRKLKGYKRAQVQKNNWRKYRAVYQVGMNRFHRNNKVDFLRLMQGIKKSVTLGKDKAKVECSDYEMLNLLQLVGSLRTALIHEGQFFSIEEKHVEYMVFLEGTLPSLAKVEEAILLEGEIDFETLEPFMAVVVGGYDHCLVAGQTAILTEESAIESFQKHGSKI